MGAERTVRNDTVVADATGIAGEGREQRVSLTDAEAAQLDVSVVDAECVLRVRAERACIAAPRTNASG